MPDAAPEIRFYRASGEYGFLSNLYPAPITVDGRLFACVERAYQFGKPSDPDVAEWLMAAPSATLCAQAAHALLPWQVRKDWNAVKVGLMRRLLRLKFGQNPGLAEQLKATAGARLVEESKTDAFWGVGKKGTGKNMLGQLLEAVRAELLLKGALTDA